MKTVLFNKVVHMELLCKEFTGNHLHSLIGTSDDGFNLKITVDSQALFKYGMYYYDVKDGYCERSLDKFWDLLEELGIPKGSYQPHVREQIAELALRYIEKGDSPYCGDFVRVGNAIYVHQKWVCDIVDVEEFSKDKIKISASFLSDNICILREVLE